MKSVSAYIHFDGHCRQAMSFYQQCLGGELMLNAFPDDQGRPSPDPAAKILHSQLNRRGAPILMASDSPPGPFLKTGNNFSVSMECDSEEEIDRLFRAVGSGGSIRLPLGA